MKKSVHILSLLLALSMVILSGCGTPAPAATASPTPAPIESAAPEAPKTGTLLRVATLKGPTGMGMSCLMEANENAGTANTYAFTVAAAPADVTTAFINGDVDVAAVPINLAAVLAAKTDNVRLLAINTLGVLYVLENGDTVNSLSDLSGKTIQATGQGSTPEYILNYLLESAGVSDDVTVEYLGEHSELAALMASGQSTLGMLPEPNVTVAMTKNPDLRVALDLTAEWEAATGAKLVQGCIIARADFAEENAGALSVFLDEYADSVDRVNADPAAAAELIAKFGIVDSAAIAETAIPNCNMVCITGSDMVDLSNAMFNVLFQANPASIGGAIPDAKIYF